MTWRRFRPGISAGLTVFVIAYLVAAFFLPLCAYLGGRAGKPTPISDLMLASQGVKRLVLIVACVLYGFNRIKPHPVVNPAYLRWLATTPWTPRLPLPLGPIHLVWHDWVLLATAAALANYDAGLNPAWPLIAFGGVFLLLGMIALSSTSSPEALLLAVAFGGLLFTDGEPSLIAVILAAMYAVFYIGLIRSLKRFPWGKAPPVPQSAAAARGLAAGLGWPFAVLSPDRVDAAVKYSSAIRSAALIGWYVYAWVHLWEPLVNYQGLCVCAVLAGVLMGVIRYSIYVRENKSPISVWGRICTGRLVIPRYDYVMLAPLATFLTPVVVVCTGRQMQSPLPLVAALAAGAGVLVSLAVGPSLRHWRLTGGHRIVMFLSGPGNRRVYLKA
jgi:hypothetical protein